MSATVGSRIKDAREKLGITQTDLGERFGISRGAVAQWEGDQCLPDVAKIVDLADTLSISLDWLMRGMSAPDRYVTSIIRPDRRDPSAASVEDRLVRLEAWAWGGRR